MPDIIAHDRFGDAVFEALPKEARSLIVRGLYDLATIGPDLWFSYRFWLPHKFQQGKPKRGSQMHDQKTGAYLSRLLSLALEAEGEARRQLFSYFCGFVCHYCLDTAAHPYIIYRTGLYDRNHPETLPWRGNHTRMERAIDSSMLKRWPEGGTTPILKKILYLRRLPSAIRPAYDRLHQEIYIWQHASADMNRCIRHQRFFYLLAQDPAGITDKLLKKLDNGISENDFTALSYYHKDREDLDVLNNAHKLWVNPWAPEITSSESFDEIFARARNHALAILNAAWRQYQGEAANSPALIGNLSYSTGLCLHDLRNNNKPIFDPLPFKNYNT